MSDTHMSERDHELSPFVATLNSVSRRDFIRTAAVAGVAIPLVGAFGNAAATNTTQPQVVIKSLLRIGMNKPLQTVGPFTTTDPGGLGLLGQAGEYLAFSNNNFELEPRVAESWRASKGSTVWTFKIRKGITFHNGKKLTANDVVATFTKHLDPANKSQAADVLKGVVKSTNIKAIDTFTVQFILDAPTGGFPFIVSSDTYNLIILPADWQSNWTKDFIGCGPWMMEKYTIDDGVTFKRNPNYWDKKRRPAFERMECTFFTLSPAARAQLLAGKLDAVTFIDPMDAKLLPKTKFSLQTAKTTAHLQVHMNCKSGPFSDKRVRQAAALTLDRPGIIKNLLAGAGDLGNDSPMAWAYATTDKSVGQRKKDIAKAKSLMAAAGVSKGFTVTLESFKRDDIVKLAQIIQPSFAQIGITVKLNITDGYGYYDHAWLNSDLGINDYDDHRAIPDVFLNRIFKSTGDWNAAHYNNPKFDAAADRFIKAADFAKRRLASKELQTILLEDTPVIIAYFANTITATKKNLKGFRTTGMGHFDATGANLT
ncbi:MAG: ABC transporter substrate-binding protein [Ilumatobacteraceae bacterium]